MNEVENKKINNENIEQREFYSSFSIAALILTCVKCLIFIVNIFLDAGIYIKQPLLAASLVIAIIGRKKYKDKLSLIMIIVDIVLMVIEVVIFIIVVALLALILYG